MDNENGKILDCFIFLIGLLISLAIGIYYSFRQKTISEYIHGSRELSLLPVSFSIAVSFVSAITMQGIPAEVYLYGVEIAFALIGMLIGIIIINITFVPLYYELKLTSVFEYLRYRYNARAPELLGCSLAIIMYTMYNGIVFLGSALAVESILGIPTVYNIFIMAVVCTVYTSLGGLRAVIWTDAFQAVLMLSGLILILTVGLKNIEVDNIWQALKDRGRTTIQYIPDITHINSAWILLLYAIRTCVTFSNQTTMMRYTSLRKKKLAHISTILGITGFVIFETLAMIIGAVIFVFYSEKGCGPLGGKAIRSSNQIVPYFVLDLLNYPGFPGLFVSALVAATLSTVSSSLNSISTVFWKNIASHSVHLHNVSESKKTLSIKVLVVIFSSVSIGISLLIMYVGGTLFQITATALGAFGGPPFGMFILGATFPFVGGLAATLGCLCSVSFLTWLAMGRIFYGNLWPSPTLITDTCGMNATLYNANVIVDDNTNFILLHLYSISPYAYHTIGIAITMVVGLVLSLFPCMRPRKSLDIKYLFPLVRKIVEPISRKSFRKSELANVIHDSKEMYTNTQSIDTLL